MATGCSDSAATESPTRSCVGGWGWVAALKLAHPPANTAFWALTSINGHNHTSLPAVLITPTPSHSLTLPLTPLTPSHALSLFHPHNQPTQFVDEAEPQQLDIQEGKHPQLDLALDGTAVANSLHLSWDGTRAAVITGPNMGGKSVLIRQAAVTVIMAQVSCRVCSD